MSDFAEFWSLYPRRVAKKDAERAWIRMTSEHRFAAIQSLPIHIRYWEAAGTSKEFLPYPASWLNGHRWEDELEMPKAPEAAWWKTEKGIEAKACELGMYARPGESHFDLKARILAKERAA